MQDGMGVPFLMKVRKALHTRSYNKEIPDAYERLLLDALDRERRLFINSDELDAAWSLFIPVLKELEEKKIVLEYYPYGSRNLVGAHYLTSKYNVRKPVKHFVKAVDEVTVKDTPEI